MKRLYKAFVYLNDGNPITMIVSGKNKKEVALLLTNFYRKISGAAEIEVKLREVIYIDGNYRYK